MRRDSRLSLSLHALLHMEQLGAVVTSEALAPMMRTSPVVVRRTMGGLREAGIVRSEKGHGGGWSLARPLDRVSLGDVYDALGMPAIFSLGHRDESPGCLVEQAVNRALGDALDAAEAVLMKQLRSTSLADLASDFRHHNARHSQPARRKKHARV